MDNSILLSKFIGPYITVIGIGLLFNPEVCRKIMDDFFRNAALTYARLKGIDLERVQCFNRICQTLL